MLYSTFQLLQQSEKLRDESYALIENSKIIKARSMTLVARSKQVSAAIADAEAKMMANTLLSTRQPPTHSLFRQI